MMNDRMTQPIVFIPDAGELPDVFTEVVNALPADLKPRIAPWSGTVGRGQEDVEKLLDKHELRRIILVGGGRGAAVALRVAQAQPGRITHLVLDTPVISLDEQTRKVGRALKRVPGFLFRGRNKEELLNQVDELDGTSAGDFADVATPTLIISGTTHPELVDALPRVVTVSVDGAGPRTYRTHPGEFGAHLGRFLADS
ncbi:alpha/beta hydrolase [Corynebacterium sp. Sa1YVA5]|uniref:Alpha/beta hydrolase n=2 Tax=Corynebacterium gallinarum TaxID=2762214 RepID=A0A8I0HNY4_9CORY|nr:alpha/beta hydrolase [Corynebacterium gallinarum]NMB22940.1 alpha/beta hydrolase [Corynebacterium sp.]